MGMYDELAVSCPNCLRTNFLQSKSGSCELKTYREDNVPFSVLTGVDTQFRCDNCESLLELIVKTEIHVEKV